MNTVTATPEIIIELLPQCHYDFSINKGRTNMFAFIIGQMRLGFKFLPAICPFIMDCFPGIPDYLGFPHSSAQNGFQILYLKEQNAY